MTENTQPSPPTIFEKTLSFISKWTRETSDIMLVALFTLQMFTDELISNFILTIAMWLIYWAWRRDNWLVSIYNLLLFWFAGNEYFDLLGRCFVFYCGSNICYYANKNKVATTFHILFLVLFLFFGNFGFRENRDVICVLSLSLFFPLFFVDVQNELLNVHFFTPYIAMIIVIYSTDEIRYVPFIFAFLTSIKSYPSKYPTFHNTYNSRKLIITFAISLVSFYFEYTRGVGIKSVDTSYDALHMLLMMTAVVVSYLGIVFWNREYSKQFRYGYTALHSITAFVNSILLSFTALGYFTEAAYKLWLLPPVGNDRSLQVIVTMLVASSSLICIVFDWRTKTLIQRTVFAHFFVFFVDNVAMLIAYFLMNYLDFYRSDVILRFGVSGFSMYIAFKLIKESGSSLIIDSSDKYKEMYDFINEWAEVKKINLRDTGDKVVLEAKCQNRNRSARVGVIANGLFPKAKKMGLDYTIEIIDAPKPKK